MPTLICVTPELEKINYNMKIFNDSCYPDDDDNGCYPDSTDSINNQSENDSSDTCWPD